MKEGFAFGPVTLLPVAPMPAMQRLTLTHRPPATLTREDIQRVNASASTLLEAAVEGERPAGDPLDVVMDHRVEFAKLLRCAPTFSGIMTRLLELAPNEHEASAANACRNVSTQVQARAFLLKNGIVPKSMRTAR